MDARPQCEQEVRLATTVRRSKTAAGRSKARHVDVCRRLHRRHTELPNNRSVSCRLSVSNFQLEYSLLRVQPHGITSVATYLLMGTV
jgi:hypothetical protein